MGGEVRVQRVRAGLRVGCVVLGVIFTAHLVAEPVMLGHPVAIHNIRWTCYIAASLQVLHAIQPILAQKLPRAFWDDTEAVSPWGLFVDTVRQAVASDSDMSTITPTCFFQGFMQAHAALIPRHYIIMRYRDTEGVVHRKEMCEPRIGAEGYCGTPVAQVVRFVIDDLWDRCQKEDVYYPIAWEVIRARDVLQHSIPVDDYVQHSLSQHGPISIIMLENTVSGIFPLEVMTEQGCYQLCAVSYVFPYVKQFGYLSNHAIAFVRYHDEWYSCDDAMIASHPRVYIERIIQEHATTTFYGPGMDCVHAYKHVIPHILVYTLVH